jgi:hypothetical protein
MAALPHDLARLIGALHGFGSDPVPRREPRF